VLKCNPDAPQRAARLRALREGKHVYVAVPRLTEPRCFLHLDPRRLGDRLAAAATIKGAAKLGAPVAPRQLPHIDLIVAGSVAVSRRGARVGKGGGYSDLESALGREAGGRHRDARARPPLLPTATTSARDRVGCADDDAACRHAGPGAPATARRRPRRQGVAAGVSQASANSALSVPV
jgi:5-formyltetrahydrofolate cyclo-ligase family